MRSHARAAAALRQEDACLEGEEVAFSATASLLNSCLSLESEFKFGFCTPRIKMRKFGKESYKLEPASYPRGGFSFFYGLTGLDRIMSV